MAGREVTLHPTGQRIIDRFARKPEPGSEEERGRAKVAEERAEAALGRICSRSLFEKVRRNAHAVAGSTVHEGDVPVEIPTYAFAMERIADTAITLGCVPEWALRER